MTSNTDEVTSLLSTLNCQYLYSDNCVICLKEFCFWKSEFFQDFYEFESRNNIKKEEKLTEFTFLNRSID